MVSGIRQPQTKAFIDVMTIATKTVVEAKNGSCRSSKQSWHGHAWASSLYKFKESGAGEMDGER